MEKYFPNLTVSRRVTLFRRLRYSHVPRYRYCEVTSGLIANRLLKESSEPNPYPNENAFLFVSAFAPASSILYNFELPVLNAAFTVSTSLLDSDNLWYPFKTMLIKPML